MAVQRIGIGLDNRKPYNRNVIVLRSPEAAAYVEKAVLAGGTGGSGVCATKTFETLEGIPTPGYALADNYTSLALAAGGSGGSTFCAQDTFSPLEAIETPGFAEADTYTQLATAAGGTGGSTFCAQKTFSKLV